MGLPPAIYYTVYTSGPNGGWVYTNSEGRSQQPHSSPGCTAL
jgi:hypothetical protein